MLKFLFQLRYSFLIIALISCGNVPETEQGFIEGDTYHNNMIKFSMSFPLGWSIIKDEETLKLIGQGEPTERLLLEKWKKAKAKPLVSCYRFSDKDYEIKKDVLINPNVTAMIEYIPGHVNIKNAYEYIPKYKDALLKHKNIEYRFEANQTVTLNGYQFELVEFEFDQFKKVIRKRSYLYKYGDYLLNITMIWEKGDSESLSAMIQSLFTIKIHQVL